MATTKPILLELPIEQLRRGIYQPRTCFEANELEELAQSIRQAGLLQPIVVRPLSETAGYEIIAGERRWRAAQLAGLDTVPCLVNQFSDEQALEATTIENISRVDLNPIEEARAYQRFIDEFGYVHEEIAAAVGKSRAKITNMLRLLNLSDNVQTLLMDGRLSEGHGKLLAALPAQYQQQLAQTCVKQQWSVRQLERAIKQQANHPNGTTDTTAVNIKALEKSLSDHLGSTVHIQYQGKAGTLQIDFHDLDILDGILQKMRYQKT